jgi:AAA+ ATPase superfamily predicted ATPase
MKTPFVFGQQATGVDFTDRKRELDQLLTNFGSGINTILISPRRWGKSSLVRKAAETMNRKNKKVVICFLDLYNIRDEGQFYQQLAHSVINSTIRKIEELMSAVKKYLPKLMPRISLDTPAGDFELGVQWKEIVRTPDEIINLAERIAEDRNIRIVICIDEFQNIASYEHQIALQKKLRSHWHKHRHVSYCLYGSKSNMLTEVFT